MLNFSQFINENLSVSQLKKYIQTENFKNWFKGSKIVDEKSEPLICYHYSKTKFNNFNNEYITKNGWLGAGFYFSDNKFSFKKYGRYKYEVFLNIKNPYISDASDWFGFTSEVCKKYNSKIVDTNITTELLRLNGFDGVIFTHGDLGVIISCFDASQIRIIE